MTEMFRKLHDSINDYYRSHKLIALPAMVVFAVFPYAIIDGPEAMAISVVNAGGVALLSAAHVHIASNWFRTAIDAVREKLEQPEG